MPFYKEFDEVLSGRPVVELAMIKEVGEDFGEEDEQAEAEAEAEAEADDINDDDQEEKETNKKEDVQVPEAVGNRGKMHAKARNEGAGKAKRSRKSFKDRFL